MPDKPNEGLTETSPLLGNSLDHAGQSAPKNGGSVHRGPLDDVESEQHIENGGNPDVVQGRKVVKSVLPVLGLGIFLAFLDQSIIATINGEIGSDLHALKHVSWVATAYFLTMTASQPLYGKLSDVFGRKPCLVFAFSMFGVGSLGCGVANSMEMVIVGRAIQGIGGGGLMIVVTVLVSDFISLRERGTYQGYLNLIGAVGSTSGGPIGGLFAQSIGWRWAFLIQVILCLVAIACVVVFLHLPKRQSEMPWKQQLARIDILGALLLVSAIFSLLFGLDRGNNLSWSNPLAIGSLCATIPLSIAFLVVETRFAHEPFTPAHIIFNRALFACYSQNFFGFAAFTSFTIYLPMFFQVILNMTPVLAGLSLIPAAISVVFGSIIGGMVLKRTGRFYWLAVCSSTMAALGSIFIVVAPSLDRGSLISILIGSVVSFVPQGTTMISSLISIISNVSAADQAVATASAFLFRSLGAAIGVCLVGVLIQSVLQTSLYASLEAAEANRLLKGIAQSFEFIKDLPPPLRETVQESYSHSTQAGFALCLGFLVMASLSVYWWREKPLSR